MWHKAAWHDKTLSLVDYVPDFHCLCSQQTIESDIIGNDNTNIDFVIRVPFEAVLLKSVFVVVVAVPVGELYDYTTSGSFKKWYGVNREGVIGFTGRVQVWFEIHREDAPRGLVNPAPGPRVSMWVHMRARGYTCVHVGTRKGVVNYMPIVCCDDNGIDKFCVVCFLYNLYHPMSVNDMMNKTIRSLYLLPFLVSFLG